ncbi:GNAT family N-acetyltransferase [Nonomuraea sp. NPDC049709]|uniref:GNAT family N-acetyltransferase n=1 Tax=Nonomuraea sp. NPDC049709 TaxID=3154736 RepID=UPI00342EEB9F
MGTASRDGSQPVHPDVGSCDQARAWPWECFALVACGSYDAVVDGQVVGMIVYPTQRGDQRVTLSHTVAEPEYRGRGIATRLVKHALDDLQAQDLKLTDYCPIVADNIADHPEYKELIDSRFPGRATVPDRAPRERAN